LKILHLSDSGLPDWRIEKAACTGLKNGHQLFFAGKKSSSNPIFTKTLSIEWNSKSKRGIPFYWQSVKKQLAKILNEVRPDIVHAHDIFSSKIASLFKIPLVYDDHEYWSQLAKVKYSNGEKTTGLNPMRNSLLDKFSKLRESLLDYQIRRTWMNWERDVVLKYPTIVISDKIADDMKRTYPSTRIYVVPNYPLATETKNLQKPIFHKEFSSVYMGIDKKWKQQPNRDLSELLEVFRHNDIGQLTIIGWDREHNGKISATGFLNRNQLFNEMYRHSIGLIPWKKHWSHKFINPNKAYEYAHAGLFVLCISSLQTISETLKENCITFEDKNDMVMKLRYLKENPNELYKRRLKIFEYARNNLIWERYENNILTAYNSV
jgi:glycosyltransferase involved in cell wall biosynthesis